MNKPCKNCPFLKNSSLGYDADALKCLKDGLEPSCHEQVGYENVFADTPPVEGFNCVGYIHYMKRKKGYAKPRLAE